MSEYAHDSEQDSDSDSDGGQTEKADVLAPPGEEIKNKPGLVPDRDWVRVILAAEQSFKPLIGHFTNSCAFIRGETLLVRPANPNIKHFVPENVLVRYFTPVVKSILGREYRIKYDND